MQAPGSRTPTPHPAEQTFDLGSQQLPAGLDHPVPVGEGILVSLEQQAAAVQEEDVVGDLVEVGGDVGGEEDADPLLLDLVREDVEQLLPHKRVEVGGRFVHQQ